MLRQPLRDDIFFEGKLEAVLETKWRVRTTLFEPFGLALREQKKKAFHVSQASVLRLRTFETTFETRFEEEV